MKEATSKVWRNSLVSTVIAMLFSCVTGMLDSLDVR